MSAQGNSSTTVPQPGYFGDGDTYLVRDLLPDELANTAFERLKNEVQWLTMHHHGGEVPRLVAVEGQINEDGSYPIYRHPSDESPPLKSFSSTVSLIRENVEKVLRHPVNHVLIQYYRSGNDYISEHSDKTIDVVRGSKIVNVSLGAERLMILRMKKDVIDYTFNSSNQSRTAQRIPLPHNSMFVLGLRTNARWLHAIRQDKRLSRDKTSAEKAFGGERISLTFRHIGTFLIENEKNKQLHIWGQGGKGKTKDAMRLVIIGDEIETGKMIHAFGKENQTKDFEWEGVYGEGFDILHFTLPNSQESSG